MTIESVNYVGDLNPTLPSAADPKSEGDDHLRNLKTALVQSLAGYTGTILVTGTDGGAANAYTITPAKAIPAYGLRMEAVFSPVAAPTGPATLSISGLPAVPLVTVSGSAINAGDLVPGRIYRAVYDGTQFRLSSVLQNYIDQLAFGTALPAQAGNAGKFITTNGTSARWDYSGISTVNAPITASATLSGTYLYVPVQMASLGQSVTLPAATTLSVGGPQYIIDNTKGGYPAGIRDNTGMLLMAVASGGEALISLKDNSTAAGVWSVTGSNLEPGLITIDSTFSSTYTSTVLAPFVALDNNTSIHFAALSSGFAAFVVDNVGKVVGTPVTVDTTSGQAAKSAFKISSTQIICFTSSKSYVLTLTGSSPNYSISVSAPAAFGTADDFAGAPKIAQLTPTLYVLMSANGLSTTAMAVSGTTISFGTTVTVAGDTIGDPAIYTLTSTTALVIYGTNSGSAVNAYVVSVSGTTITAGTVVAGAAGGVGSMCLLSPTKAMSVNSSGSGCFVQAITISGTTVTFGAALTVEAAGTMTLAYTGSSATRYNPHLFPLSANTALLWYLDSNSISRAVVLTESSGTMTAGPILYRSISTAAAGASGYGYILPQGTNEFCAIIEKAASTAGYSNFVTTFKISGTTITVGNATDMPLAPTQPERNHVTRLSSGKYVVHGVSDSNVPCVSMPVFSSNGDAINFMGTIKTPAMNDGGNSMISVTRAVAPNRIVVIGYAIYSPSGGVSAYQLRLLNVEIAA